MAKVVTRSGVGKQGARTPWMIGGHLGADFLNTIDARGQPNVREHLTDYASLLRWLSRTNLLTSGELTELRAYSAAHSDSAEKALAEIVAFREVAHAIVVDGSFRETSRTSSANALRTIACAVGERRAVLTRRGLEWRWNDAAPLRRPLHALALQVADLLEPANLSRVHVCAGEDCDWVFLDTSPSQRRRWCHMSACGNRAKVRKLRARRRSGER